MPLSTDLPKNADDPRLQNWHQTIELGDGLVSSGEHDLRTLVELYGLPESLEGKTALDVGTSDGFWAFEMEQRGARRVVAIELGRWGDSDWLPWIRESKAGLLQQASRPRFDIAHAMRGSRVEHKVCSVYELSPDTVGTFDVVVCAAQLIHVQNPMKALVNIASVTREMAIIGTVVEKRIQSEYADRPWLRFGHRDFENTLGEAGIYWRFSTRGLQELMEYCGFASTRPMKPFHLPKTEFTVATVIGSPRAPE